MSAADEIGRRLRPSRAAIDAANKEFGRVLGMAAAEEAPKLTTRLATTLLTGFNQSNPSGTGSISMPYYGRIVIKGSSAHPIPNAFGRGITVLHPGTAPNDFLSRALQRPEVQEFKHRLPAILMSFPDQGGNEPTGKGFGRFSPDPSIP